MKSFWRRCLCIHIMDVQESEHVETCLDLTNGLKFNRYREIVKCRKCGEVKERWNRKYHLPK